MVVTVVVLSLIQGIGCQPEQTTLHGGHSRLMSGVPCAEFPHSCNGKSLSGDGSSMGEVVLCWGFVEQARHEHVSDEYKTGILL